MTIAQINNQLYNVEQVRQQASQSIEQGAVTEDYSLDREQACQLLNEAKAIANLVRPALPSYHSRFICSGGIHVCQIDACRLGGVNEVLAVLLMAAKFGLPVCPHGGGVGLPEYVQHLSIFDYICVSGTLEGRFIEYVEHLHENFLDPVTIKNGHYMPPTKPGFSIQMKPESLDEYEYPHGKAWQQS